MTSTVDEKWESECNSINWIYYTFFFFHPVFNLKPLLQQLAASSPPLSTRVFVQNYFPFNRAYGMNVPYLPHLLFILAMEPLALWIHSNPTFKSINILLTGIGSVHGQHHNIDLLNLLLELSLFCQPRAIQSTGTNSKPLIWPSCQWWFHNFNVTSHSSGYQNM